MTAFALPFGRFLAAAPSRAETGRTPPPPPSLPVLIHDVATPYRGETLLSARLRADLERALAEGHDADG